MDYTELLHHYSEANADYLMDNYTLMSAEEILLRSKTGLHFSRRVREEVAS